ncbi:MAG: LytTR family DNA-binding domain-containing protein [Eubacteriales bacterium]|nr:LytTR family DNA-binding domain-containing protein [Eubacteriales bacterium]
MKIVICDDDKLFVEQIVGYLKKYSAECSKHFMIRTFYRADHFLEYIFNNDVDILFLDMLFKNEDINGIDVAKQVRKNNHKIKIVFLTVEEKYALQGYAVDASGYFVKPINYDNLKNQLNDLFSELEHAAGFAEKTDKGYVVFDFSEVMYIETESRKTNIHTISGNYISMRTMKEQEEIFCDRRFMRCHSSYIVNFQYIRSINGLDIIMKNGDRVSLSKYKKKKFMDSFMEYLDSYLLV